MKVESAQNTAFDQVPFCLRKIILEGKCKVHILIWQINVSTLKQTNSNNKQREAHVLSGRKIFLVFKNCLLRRIFPYFCKAMFIFHLCPLHLERAKLTVFLPVCADVAENPSGQSAIFAHSRFQSSLSLEQGF